MSDCFDHAADAYDDLCFGRTSDEGVYGNAYRDPNNWQSVGRTCKICKTHDLHWHVVDGRWQLCIKGKPHKCIERDVFKTQAQFN